MLLAVLLLLAAPKPASALPAGELLTTVQVGKKGAAEICLTGAKTPGASLLFRVETWRGKALVGSVEVPDKDARAAFAQCRPLPEPAVSGDSLKVYSVGARPKSLTVNPRPGAPD